ncbi:MAG: HU family DNA-binding protein [Lachnospiraceae bacterium]|nr:HU family DNA-binding protein [Lachnospiraceae bacterium]
MNKKDFIAAVAEKAQVTKKDAEAIINATFEELTALLAKGEKFSITGFGTFEVRERKERTGRNPHSQETVKIPACKAPGFKASRVLKEAVNVTKKG